MARKFFFILASASERRSSLLEKAGYDFKVVPSDIDEASMTLKGMKARDYACRLALLKASDVADKFPDNFILGADTVVDFDGHIIGKPSDSNHAEEITRKLFSKSHKVITGVAIIHKLKRIRIVKSDTTVVYPKKMTEEQIRKHIEGGSWQGKAGAYGIQETGDEFVEKIDGSFTNVMGLPMELVEKIFKSLEKYL
jgi:septum formation protein